MDNVFRDLMAIKNAHPVDLFLTIEILADNDREYKSKLELKRACSSSWRGKAGARLPSMIVDDPTGTAQIHALPPGFTDTAA